MFVPRCMKQDVGHVTLSYTFFRTQGLEDADKDDDDE